ncbi:hypothetical protein MTO96_036122 [Rhipicephalus appendiculatus]
MGLSGEALLAWVSAEEREMRDQRAKDREEARLAAQADHEQDERRAGGHGGGKKTTEEEEEKEGTSCRGTCGSLAGGSGEDSGRRASAPAFLRRALDRTCLSRFQFQWVCPRSSSGGPSKVRGRGLESGSCQGAVAEAGLVDEAYLVRLSATSVSTALHIIAHPCAVNHACRAASALTHVDEHIMPGRRGTQL